MNPHPGQASAANFIEFREDPFVLFAEDLPDLYSTTKWSGLPSFVCRVIVMPSGLTLSR